MNFQEAEGEYRRLGAERAAGALSDEQYEAQVQRLMVQDAQGRWWTLGGATGQWYVHDGVAWVIAEPPGQSVLSSGPPGGRAPQAPGPDGAPSSMSRKPWLWTALGVLIVAILAMLLSRVAPDPSTGSGPRPMAGQTAPPTASSAALAPTPVPPTARQPGGDATATSQTIAAAATDTADRARRETAGAQSTGTAASAAQTRSAQLAAASATALAIPKIDLDARASTTAAASATAFAAARPASVTPAAAAPPMATAMARPTQTATPRLSPSPPAACAVYPGGSFASAWTAGNLRELLGCPNRPEASVSTSYEPFANGFMVWRGDTRRVIVFHQNGEWQEFADTWVEGQPDYSCTDAYTPAQTPPTPHRGFGKVWCMQPGVRERLGAALQDEMGNDRPVQDFEKGALMLIRERGTKPIILLRDGSRWQETP
jgi:hypothetical protein